MDDKMHKGDKAYVFVFWIWWQEIMKASEDKQYVPFCVMYTIKQQS